MPWEAVGVIVALLGLPVSVILTRLGVAPRRRLLIDLQHVPADEPERFPGVQDPHTALLTLACDGWRDISSSDFNNAQPLVLETGVSIRTHLVKTRPDHHPIPDITTNEHGQVHVRPGLFRRRQLVEITLLTHGPPEYLDLGVNPLVNVKVHQETRSSKRHLTLRWLAVLPAYVLVTLATGEIYKSLEGGVSEAIRQAGAWIVIFFEGWVATTLVRRPTQLDRIRLKQ